MSELEAPPSIFEYFVRRLAEKLQRLIAPYPPPEDGFSVLHADYVGTSILECTIEARLMFGGYYTIRCMPTNGTHLLAGEQRQVFKNELIQRFGPVSGIVPPGKETFVWNIHPTGRITGKQQIQTLGNQLFSIVLDMRQEPGEHKVAKTVHMYGASIAIEVRKTDLPDGEPQFWFWASEQGSSSILTNAFGQAITHVLGGWLDLSMLKGKFGVETTDDGREFLTLVISPA